MLKTFWMKIQVLYLSIKIEFQKHKNEKLKKENESLRNKISDEKTVTPKIIHTKKCSCYLCEGDKNLSNNSKMAILLSSEDKSYNNNTLIGVPKDCLNRKETK